MTGQELFLVGLGAVALCKRKTLRRVGTKIGRCAGSVIDWIQRRCDDNGKSSSSPPL